MCYLHPSEGSLAMSNVESQRRTTFKISNWDVCIIQRRRQLQEKKMPRRFFGHVQKLMLFLSQLLPSRESLYYHLSLVEQRIILGFNSCGRARRLCEGARRNEGNGSVPVISITTQHHSSAWWWEMGRQKALRSGNDNFTRMHPLRWYCGVVVD